METTARRDAGRRYFPKAITEQILAEVAAGKSLGQVCEDPSMPCKKTIYNWIAGDVDFSQRYAAAVRVAVERRAAK